MSELSIKDVELRISRNLQLSFKTAFEQAGYAVSGRSRLRVSLVDASGRKKRSNAKADNWSPDSGRLQVWFEPDESTSVTLDSEDRPLRAPAESPTSDIAPMPVQPDSMAGREVEAGLAIVIRALARAETTPGWSFVSLKKFRDEILPSDSSSLSLIDQRQFLGYAINEKLFTTNKVVNPKDPRFPTTTIRLNRLNGMVQKVLGGQTRKSLGFTPIHIKGEPLSATILRERR